MQHARSNWHGLVRSLILLAAAGAAAAEETGTSPEIRLSDIIAGTGCGFVILGINAGDAATNVAGAGDVNGDGRADLLIGAPGADPGGTRRAGESYVVFGKAGAAPVDLADVAAGIGGFVLTGIDADDYSGRSVSGAGDVNGDGLDDLIIGASGGDPGAVSAGESYVVFGKAGTAPVALADVAAGTGGFTITGRADGDLSGWSVSGAGDVNGDGLHDVIVGAPRADPGGVFRAGEAYVIFGKNDTNAVALSDVARGLGGFVINGIEADDHSGYSVSDAGDVNGDGLADLVVGVPYAAHPPLGFAGKSYVIFGRTTTTAVDLASIGAGFGKGFLINGIAVNDQVGISVDGAGDVNGDGLDDLLVGAFGGAVGRSFVVFGRTTPTPVDLNFVVAGTGGFVMNEAEDDADTGLSVAGAGDVNGDGLPDLLVGAPRAEPGDVTWAGTTFLVYGTPDTRTVDLAAVGAGIGGFGIRGIAFAGQCGTTVSGAGDVNGDGRADIIVGALGPAPAGFEAGASFVIFGPPPCPADIDTSGGIDLGDLLAVLSNWGACTGCPADLDGDDDVGLTDLLIVLSTWGVCPRSLD